VKKLLRPNVLAPLILLVALAVALLSFGDPKKLLTLVTHFHRDDLLYFFLLMVAYEAVRGVQWLVMLRALGVKARLRTQTFAFIGGEVTKSLPVGNYFQNYLLQQSDGTAFGRSSAATTLIIWIEVVVSLVALLFLGPGSWVWLRPTIIGGVIAFALIAWALYAWFHSTSAPDWMARQKRLRGLMEGVAHFREGAAVLMKPRLLLVETLLGAVYLVLGGAGLYVITRGLDITTVTFTQALAIYFVGLAVGLIIPIPVDLGLTELGGIGTMLSLGVARSSAVGVVLLNRVLSIVAALLIAFIAAFFLRDEFKTVLRGRGPDEDKAQAEERPVAPSLSPRRMQGAEQSIGAIGA